MNAYPVNEPIINPNSLAHVDFTQHVLEAQKRVSHLKAVRSDGRHYELQLKGADGKWRGFAEVTSTQACDATTRYLMLKGYKVRGMPKKSSNT